MSSGSLGENKYFNKLLVNRLEVNNIKPEEIKIDTLLDTKIDNLDYVGINMHPCEYCKTNKGVHFHSVNPNSKQYDNYINDEHMCDYCKHNPGKLHIHYKN